MENKFSIDEYLKRIEINRSLNGPTEEYLNELHINHLTHIPFETFDLIDLKELNISFDYIFNRIVRQNRGGVCYQMNGLFEYILKNLNYNVQLIPCKVYSIDKKKYLNLYSHASLCVTLNNNIKFLCDVGFSRDFLTPLFLRTDCIQFAINGFFRLTITEDKLNYKLERGFLNNNENVILPSMSPFRTHIIDINPELIKWIPSYQFSIDFFEHKIKLEDFQNTCPYIIHSPDVSLNHYTICHIHLYKPFIGAYGILGKEYWEWIIENGIEKRQNSSLSNDDDDDNELKKLLKEKFNLIIERKIKLLDT